MEIKNFGLLIAAICFVLATQSMPAQEPPAAPAAPEAAPAVATPAPEAAPVMSALELRKTGTVSVKKDESGKVVAITLIVNSYDIPLDEGSKPLEAMDGQKVRVRGTFSNEGGKRLFYVKSVEPPAVENAPAK